MSDNQMTELLRERLTERGIEWRSGLKGVTFVGDWCFVEYDNGKLAATCEPVLTPEQAIAAILDGDDQCDARFANGAKAPLPCPFCGGDAHVESAVPETSLGEGALAAWVICDVCRAQVERKWEDEAIEAWNRRAE